ncbi:MAG: hypothetical protein R6V86_07255, partial [Spirochaetia bacterium]
LGSRASTEVIRREKEMAYIEAAYQPQELEKINNILRESGIEPDSEIVLLSREIKHSGRNKSRINGQLATLNMIRRISRYLVDIHGQHEHQLLLNSSEHLQLVDDYVGQPAEKLKQRVVKKYKKIKEIEDKLAELQVDEGEKARELDMLNFQIKEISEANLKIGEFLELKNEYQKLSTARVFNSLDRMLLLKPRGLPLGIPELTQAELAPHLSPVEKRVIPRSSPSMPSMGDSEAVKGFLQREQTLLRSIYSQGLAFLEGRLSEAEISKLSSDIHRCEYLFLHFPETGPSLRRLEPALIKRIMVSTGHYIRVIEEALELIPRS